MRRNSEEIAIKKLGLSSVFHGKFTSRILRPDPFPALLMQPARKL